VERFLRLARETHRRSLWQVLVIHLAGAWVGFEVSEELAQASELPRWFPEFTLVLLLLLAPITVATAYVQGGLPGDADEEGADPTGFGRVLTWRNAVLVGVVALLFWLIVAAGWILLAEHLVDEFHRTAALDATRLVAAPSVTQFR